MKPKHLSLRALCVLLALSVAASTLLSGCAAASAEEPAQPAAAQVQAEPEKEKPENLIGTKKSETVYVNLDPTGRPYDTVVTDWLHSSQLHRPGRRGSGHAPGRRGGLYLRPALPLCHNRRRWSAPLCGDSL